MSIFLKTPVEMMQLMAHRVKTKRLALNLTQEGISARSGVSLGSLKRFESTGQISLESLLKLAHAVNALSDFEDLFQPESQRTSLFEPNKSTKIRQRGKLK
ncbi:MAG: helix-turn-helix transcriptional regulator [Alphaproteobacteria bacterium]|nr:helix-turn-helix transcriptional regulator [Alphaproteobacteria bacterium]